MIKRKMKPSYCNVCTEAYTDYKRKCMVCPSCEHQACQACVEHWLLTTADAHCMNCRAAYAPKYLLEHMTKSFLHTKLAKHHNDIFIQLERSLMESTQTYVNEQARRRNIEHMNQTIQTLQTALRKVTNIADRIVEAHQGWDNVRCMDLCARSMLHLNHIMKRGDAPESHQDHKVLAAVEASLDREYAALQLEDPSSYFTDPFANRLKSCNLTKMCLIDITPQSEGGGSCNKFEHLPSAKRFLELHTNQLLRVIEGVYKAIEAYTGEAVIRTSNVRCLTSKCPGFIIESTCKICKVNQCASCLTLISSNTHTCDPELVNTVKMIERSSKPCPNCKQRIEKTDGCDQMFCTECHTAFDWKTNKVIQGRIHNPHYFHWISTGGDAARAEDEARQTQQQAALGAAAPDRRLFNSQSYRMLLEVTKPLKDHHLTDYKMSAVSVRNKTSALKQCWTMMTEIMDAHVDTIEETFLDPTLRYREERADLLLGIITEATWIKTITAKRKKDNYTLALRVLLLELAVKVNDLFRPIYNATDDARMTLMPTISTNLDTICDLFREFNANSKLLSAEYNLGQFYRIELPSPLVMAVDYDLFNQVRRVCRSTIEHMYRHLHNDESSRAHYDLRVTFFAFQKVSMLEQFNKEYNVVIHALYTSLIEDYKTALMYKHGEFDESSLDDKDPSLEERELLRLKADVRAALTTYKPTAFLAGDGVDKSFAYREAEHAAGLLDTIMNGTHVAELIDAATKYGPCRNKMLSVIYAEAQHAVKETIMDLVVFLGVVYRYKYFDDHHTSIIQSSIEVPSYLRCYTNKLTAVTCKDMVTQKPDLKVAHERDSYDLTTLFPYVVRRYGQAMRIYKSKSSDNYRMLSSEELEESDTPPEIPSDEAEFVASMQSVIDVAYKRTTFFLSNTFFADSFPVYTHTFGSNRVEVPVWLKCLCSTDRHWLLDDNFADGTLDRSTPLLAYLLQPQLFNCTLNGRQVSPIEAVLLPFVLSNEPWTVEVYNRLVHRLKLVKLASNMCFNRYFVLIESSTPNKKQKHAQKNAQKHILKHVMPDLDKKVDLFTSTYPQHSTSVAACIRSIFV